jgi:hypothetical protein
MIRISPLVFALVLSTTVPYAVHADPDTKDSVDQVQSDDTTQNDTSNEASLSDRRQVGFATNKSGLMEAEVTAKMVVPGKSILKTVAPPVGGLCDKPPDFPDRPALCDEDVVIRDQPQYTGETLGVGMVLPIGWKNFFAAIPLSYTWTDTSNTTAPSPHFRAHSEWVFTSNPRKPVKLPSMQEPLT